MSIFAGFDLASESVDFYVQDEQGKVLKQGTMSWSKRKWKTFMEEFGEEDVKVAFETGPEAYRAEKILKKLGVETHPFHAAHFPAIWKTKKKTDRIDARKMCRALRAKGLPEKVQLPEDAQALLRNLITERELIVKQVGQRKNRVRGLARQWGVKLPNYDYHRPERWWDKVEAAFPEELRPMITRQLAVSLALMQSLEQLEESVETQAPKADLQKGMDFIQTVPGIGAVVSAAAAAYFGNGTRLSSGRRVGSYIGLVPTVDSTGKQKPRLGHITKEGPPALRRLFVQAAHAAVKSNDFKKTRWADWFDKLKRRRGYSIAIVALARRLATLCNTLLREETVWNPEKLRRRTP